MVRDRYRYLCQRCGYSSPKWLGRCPECGAWDSLVEEALPNRPSRSYLQPVKSTLEPRPLAQVAQQELGRLASGIRELDRVLGGGLVPGSLVLLGGSPGIGKSTILLDAALCYSRKGVGVLYVSGEESEEQTALRAKRLGGGQADLAILTATDLGAILQTAQKLGPQILIIDSIQTMYWPSLSAGAGSVGQVRECTAQLLQFAKSTNIACLLIGHVTKDGTIAGPRLLEHMVDVVLQFEGDRSYNFRILRALKNRFGSTQESGIFSMQAGGLVEVDNPAGLFLEARREGVAGSAVGACLEGNRPILAEFQALLAKTPYGLPRRTAVGFDYNRVNMLIAVLERHLGLELGSYDAYVNVVGGLKAEEPAADLPVVAALVSSYRSQCLPPLTLLFGEVGLTGEVRKVAEPERRILEGYALGFRRFIVPKGGLQLSRQQLPEAQVYQAATLAQAMNRALAADWPKKSD